jgi:methyl-accepting chemotaxis protein
MKRTGDFKETKDVKMAGKEKATARKENIHDNVTKGSFFATFKLKLIASIMVPVICIILLGTVSFFKASEIIESNYKKNTEDAINMAAECMKVGFKSVQASAAIYKMIVYSKSIL